MHHMATDPNAPRVSHPGFEKLLDLLPKESPDFKGTLYGQPASIAYFGTVLPNNELRRRAEEVRLSPPQKMCDVALAMSEKIEAAAEDRDKYFQTDDKTRNEVFMGAKWSSGWVFLMGGENPAELAQKFRERQFQVFAQNGANLNRVIDLGPRETAAAYFLQIMVRYAMIWGELPPGDDHEMSHFLEKDMPGVVVAHGKLTPAEELLCLGLMKMGAPAVVPPDYPWDLGRQVRAEGVEQILEAATKFPNLRVKDIGGKIIKLPEFCNPANAKAPFEAGRSIGGASSFFVLKPGSVDEGATIPPEHDLTNCGNLGIIIEIGDRRMDVSTSEYMENTVVKAIDYIAGLRAQQTAQGEFFIRAAKDVKPDASMIAEAVQKFTLFEYPYIEKVHVTVLTGEQAEKEKPAIDAFKSERKVTIANESDDTVGSFSYCIECQPFAKDHVCIVTPDRPPMCGRDRFQTKSAVLFGASWHPWKRRDLEGQEIRGAIQVGEPIDAKKGEYKEVNEAVRDLSPGRVTRVQIHGLREFPHTSCGCFGFLVFWLESLNGFGIMERNYKGEAPEGFNWDILANAAGGKQRPGIVGASRNYLRSKRFMQGEGGLAALRWASPKAYAAVKDLLPPNVAVTVGE